jgi:hypothetical protein
MTTTENANAPVQTPAVTGEKLVINDVEITLSRTETKAKGKSSAVAYWQFDLVQLCKDANAGMTAAELVTAHQVIGLALWDKLQAKLNQDMRACQLNGGEDTYSMSDKLARAIAYAKAGFGLEKSVVKSPMELATEQFNAQMKTINSNPAYANPANIMAKMAAITRCATEYQTAMTALTQAITQAAIGSAQSTAN